MVSEFISFIYYSEYLDIGSNGTSTSTYEPKERTDALFFDFYICNLYILKLMQGFP